MSAEGMPSPEQDREEMTLPQGKELFRAVRNGIILADQLPPIELSPEQIQRDNDTLDVLEGRVCGDCGYIGCSNCLTSGY